jgi:HEAT repeat protein
MKERKGAEVEGLAEAVLNYAERASSKMQIQERVANALGVIGELPFPGVRERAKSRLETMHIDSSVPPIVRFQAACALAKFGDGSPAVIETLRLALHEMDSQQRLNAVYALGMVGDRNVADELSRVANSDSDAEVRYAARRAHEFAAAR